MSTNLSNVTVAQLKRAIGIREHIEKLETELAGVLGGSASPASNGAGRRKMSPAARAKIAAAQRLRWAKHKKGIKLAAKVPGRRKMSPAARAKIAAAARLRWKKAKAAGRSSLAA
jgi:hypothetical protein